jgi:hypothetical protein
LPAKLTKLSTTKMIEHVSGLCCTYASLLVIECVAILPVLVQPEDFIERDYLETTGDGSRRTILLHSLGDVQRILLQISLA